MGNVIYSDFTAPPLTVTPCGQEWLDGRREEIERINGMPRVSPVDRAGEISSVTRTMMKCAKLPAPVDAKTLSSVYADCIAEFYRSRPRSVVIPFPGKADQPWAKKTLAL